MTYRIISQLHTELDGSLVHATLGLLLCFVPILRASEKLTLIVCGKLTHRLLAGCLLACLPNSGYQLGEHATWSKMTNFELGVHIPL